MHRPPEGHWKNPGLRAGGLPLIETMVQRLVCPPPSFRGTYRTDRAP